MVSTALLRRYSGLSTRAIAARHGLTTGALRALAQCVVVAAGLLV
jgi:hypothetical protein